MINIVPFNFNSHELRVITDDSGEPWFIAKDVAGHLGYSDTEAMTRRLDEDEVKKSNLLSVGLHNNQSLINESGLYSATLSSSKQEAKAFKKWVTSEVLPSIRKTGKYELKPADQQYKLPGNYIEALEALLESEKQRALDAPKVRLATLISESSNARCIRVWVKTMKNDNNLCVGERDVFRYLIDKKYIFKPRGEKGYLPYSRHESTGTGFFTVIVDEINGKPRRMLKITGKGVLNLTAKVIEHFNG